MNAGDVALEPLREAHAAVLFPLLADADIWRFTNGEPPVSEAALAARYRRLESRRSPDGTQAWLNYTIFVSHVAIGFVQATLSGTHADIAYVVGKAHRGKGHATQAVRVLLGVLVADYGARTFAATVDARNASSLRLLTRLEFVCSDERDPRNVRFEREAASLASTARPAQAQDA